MLFNAIHWNPSEGLDLGFFNLHYYSVMFIIAFTLGWYIMKKIYNVDATHNNMRIDRWFRNNIGNIPQGLIEKNLRNGKIKLNKKKIKSSKKVKTNDEIDIFIVNFIYT